MLVKDKEFELLISKKQIKERIKDIAGQINEDYQDKFPLFISILNGSFVFAADLIREVDIPSQITFIKVSSYNNMGSTGRIQELIGLQMNIFNRHIIVIDDIVDSGLTMNWLKEQFTDLGPASIEFMSLLVKPEAMTNKVNLRYRGFEIPDKFVVGYGLDYDGHGRHLKDIYQLSD